MIEAEFTRLVEDSAPRLLAYFARRVEPAADAADLLSETLTVAWRRRSKIPAAPDEQLSWLFGVAAYVLANSRRSRRRQSALVAELRSALTLRTDHDPTEATDLQLLVQDAMAAISPQSAEIVRLIHWDGLLIV
ncbi:sigma-70 family RNA polymerase sigma factor [Agromyces sp. CFH 90414]|uniref:Sigma-70 family RNA polymerase sigma factor n=1 Tax=Agromyces agglutinans TaxID=2662258 RepID=A0A6I2F049_9MICO|nr:sigma factor [Agromyces agglutinans]MRG58765.1 sigma-70 family RNA polymerase sigma factor [Agromyces agglutinans]